MKKKLMMCFAAAVEKNRDPWIESNLEALSRVELFDTDCFLWLRNVIPKVIFVGQGGYHQPVEQGIAEVSPVKLIAELVQVVLEVVILFFDWDGNPLMDISMTCQATAFDIDLQRNRLYLSNQDSGTVSVVDISEYLSKVKDH